MKCRDSIRVDVGKPVMRRAAKLMIAMYIRFTKSSGQQEPIITNPHRNRLDRIAPWVMQRTVVSRPQVFRVVFVRMLWRSCARVIRAATLVSIVR